MEDLRLVTQFAGKVIGLNVRTGDRPEAGSILLEIAPLPLKHRVSELERQIDTDTRLHELTFGRLWQSRLDDLERAQEVAKAYFDYLQEARTRLEDQESEGNLKEILDLLQVRAEFAEAQANLARANSAIDDYKNETAISKDQSQSAIDKNKETLGMITDQVESASYVRMPASGKVRMLVCENQWVQTGTVLAHITDMDS